jgi:hypothetical protein
MNPIVFIGLGIGFLLMAAGLYALTLRKPKPVPAAPTKSQLREQAALVEETKKMRIAAGVVAAFAAVLILLAYL